MVPEVSHAYIRTLRPPIARYALPMAHPASLALGASSTQRSAPAQVLLASHRLAEARHRRHPAPRRREAAHAQDHFHSLCAAPVVSRCTECSSALESCVPLLPAAICRRNCEADHSLSARLERTSVSTCSMHRWATRVLGSLTQAASKVAMPNRSKTACRPPALQLLCP